MQETWAKAFELWLDDCCEGNSRYNFIRKNAISSFTSSSGRKPNYGEECAAVFQAYIDHVGSSGFGKQ